MSDVRPNPRITQYDAPVTAPDGFLRRVLCIPVDDDYRIVAAVNDVLAWLTRPDVFNPSDEVSDIDMQALMTEMFLGYFGELEIMIGAVVPMATDVLPAFMVWCEGQILQRVNYPELYGRLHANFRLNDDEFVVPDLRTRMTVGSDGDEGDYPPGNTGGLSAVTLTISDLPSHNHSVHGHTSVNIPPGEIPIPISAETVGLPGVTGNTGGGNAHENMPPYVALRFAMVAKWRDCC